MRRKLWVAWWLVSAALLGACAKDGLFEVRIVTPPGQDPFAGAARARLTIGTVPPVTREFPVVNGSVEGDLSPAPAGVAVPITVELLDNVGNVIARGKTPELPLSVNLDGVFVEILVGRIGEFARVPGGLPAGVRHPTAELVSRFEVLIAGGTDRDGNPLAGTQIYNLFGVAFEAAADLGTPRARGVLLPLADTQVVVFGGLVPGSPAPVPTATLEVFDLLTRTFSPAQGAGGARAAPVALPVPDSTGRWLVAGGEGEGGTLDTAFLYNVADGEITSLTEKMRAARAGFTATAVQTAAGPQILLYGGAAIGSEAELYNPANRAFTELAAPDRRRDHTATLLPDGRVALVGGRDPAGTVRSDIVVYDPQCDDSACPRFATVEPVLLTPRYGHAAHLVAGNRLLIAAGRGSTDAPLGTAEVLRYDSGGRRFEWEASPALASPRADFRSVMLLTGQVFFVGGVDETGAALSTTEIFIPQ